MLNFVGAECLQFARSIVSANAAVAAVLVTAAEWKQARLLAIVKHALLQIMMDLNGRCIMKVIMELSHLPDSSRMWKVVCRPIIAEVEGPASPSCRRGVQSEKRLETLFDAHEDIV